MEAYIPSPLFRIRWPSVEAQFAYIFVSVDQSGFMTFGGALAQPSEFMLWPSARHYSHSFILVELGTFPVTGSYGSPEDAHGVTLSTLWLPFESVEKWRPRGLSFLFPIAKPVPWRQPSHSSLSSRREQIRVPPSPFTGPPWVSQAVATGQPTRHTPGHFPSVPFSAGTNTTNMFQGFCQWVAFLGLKYG